MDDYIIGTPDIQAGSWELQMQPDNCAVVAEMSLINQFGIGLTQEQADYISSSNGWYHPGGGTSPADIGNMMDMYGIPNHSVQNATLDDLARELQAGHGVIVGLDSDQLWDQGPLNDLKIALCKGLGLDSSQFMPADHAVVVTGIDASEPNNLMVILNDSGTPSWMPGRTVIFIIQRQIFRYRMGVSWDPFRGSILLLGSVREPA